MLLFVCVWVCVCVGTILPGSVYSHTINTCVCVCVCACVRACACGSLTLGNMTELLADSVALQHYFGNSLHLLQLLAGILIRGNK